VRTWFFALWMAAPAAAADVVVGAPVVKGALSKDDVAARVHGVIPGLAGCYADSQPALAARDLASEPPEGAARVSLKVVVAADGSTTSAGVVRTDAPEDQAACLARVRRAAGSWPTSARGGVVRVDVYGAKSGSLGLRDGLWVAKGGQITSAPASPAIGGLIGVGSGSASPRAPEAAKLGGEPLILGYLDRSQLDEVLLKALPALRACWPGQPVGEVVVKFTVAANGTVSAAEVKRTEAPESVGSCVVAVVKRQVFPAPKGGGIVVASYPLLPEG
jgi:hypothetical protein